MADQIGPVELLNAPRIPRVGARQQSKQKKEKDFSSWIQDKKKEPKEKGQEHQDELPHEQHDEITLTSAARQQAKNSNSKEGQPKSSVPEDKTEKNSNGSQVDITV